MKFQPGQVVHFITTTSLNCTMIVSTAVDYAYSDTSNTAYHLSGCMGHFQEHQLFTTFDNAMAELKRQNKESQ